eukprot:m51a1_g12376 putative lipid phosphate (272) ;mRNA; r:611080-612489
MRGLCNAPLLRAVPWFVASYIFDWLICGAILAIGVGFSSYSKHGHHFTSKLPMSPNNPNFMYPWKDDTVPFWAAGLIAYAVPAFFFFVAQPLLRMADKHWDVLHDLHHSLLGLAESALITLMVTETAKPFAGRYRPHYLSVVGTKHEADGHLSFPSGHTSSVFSGLLYFGMWIAGKTRMFAPHGGQMWKSVLVGVPLYAAMLVAISRVRDYHHNHSDIVAGCIIGLCCAFASYFMVYPSLFVEDCHRPKTRVAADVEECSPSAIDVGAGEP